MKKIYITTGTINDVFAELASRFNGEAHSNNNDSQLAINSGLIKGKVKGVTFINGVTSIQVDMAFSDDIELSIEPLSKSSILFAYCTEGKIEHSYGISGHKSILRKRHSGVVTGSRDINTILHFKKNQACQFSLIKVETEGLAHTINDPIISQLKKSFLTKQQNYSYQGLGNPKIASKFKRLNSITEQGMVGHTIKKEIIQSILAMEIDANTDHLTKMSRAVKSSAMNQINEFKKIYLLVKNFAVDAIYSNVDATKGGAMIK